MILILENSAQVRYFTDMRKVVATAGINAQDYDWFISDIYIKGFAGGMQVAGPLGDL